MTAGIDVKHESSLSHVTGQSIFIDDRLTLQRELFVGIVGAPVSCGQLLNVDVKEAMAVPGFVGSWTAQDLAHNRWGTIVMDQPLLVEDRIMYFGEPVAIVATTCQRSLEESMAAVKIGCKEEEPILSIQAGRARKDFLYHSTPIERGDVVKFMKAAEHRLSGIFRVGGQEHFYLESQAAIAYANENGEIEVHSSSQHPAETQHVVAHALGLALNKVVCVVKRMGGGFGGKESQAAPIAALAALVAQKTRRPARLILTKDQDMIVTGKRHPFETEYEVGFNSEGLIIALRAHHFADAGAYTDLSPSIIDRALFHSDGCYYIPNIQLQGSCVRTNYHSHTAFRGFGGPQGNFLIEKLLEDIAIYLKKDPFQIREINLYRASPCNLTPYQQEVEDSVLAEIFAQLKTEAGYVARRLEVDKFNSAAGKGSCGRLRGLGVSGVKFGIAFTARFLNQANALVIVNRDGSVQVATGATEMGQGVHTKIEQLLAAEFGLEAEQITTLPTRTDRNANTSPTAASSGTDLNGAAAVKAALAIKLRFAWVTECLRVKWKAQSPIDEVGLPPDGFSGSEYSFVGGRVVHFSGQSWSLTEVIATAYLNRLSLSEYAHFRTEGIGFDKATGLGKPFKYFTQGAALSEVELNCYTGEVKVRRVDILLDIGRSINPGIDRGQVTGGFMQGQGWVTTENLVYTQKGQLLSHSPTTYKIPNIQDTPRDFRIKFFEHSGCADVVFRSKAVGEPPFLLATSIWTGIVNALSYSAKAGQLPKISVPATNEAIVMELASYE